MIIFIIENFIINSEYKNFDLVKDFYDYKKSISGHTSIFGGYQPRFRTIKHIYPILNSKISVENNENTDECYFGEHLPYASLYKFVNLNGSNQMLRKSTEEILKELDHTSTQIGIYSIKDEINEEIAAARE